MPNTEFDLGGINHLALVSSDMQRTIGFYSGVGVFDVLKGHLPEYDNRDEPVVEVAAPEGYGSRDISADLTAGS